MRRRHFLCLACALGPAAAARGQPHAAFGYEGDEGPSRWGELNEHWRACSVGVNQSPVDLAGFIEAELPPLEIAYAPAGQEAVHTGHAIQVNASPGSRLGIDGRSFTLLQFHFHAPSEHRLEGRDFPLEAHLVHQDAEGSLAVIGVLFEAGAPNPLLERLAAALPAAPGERRRLDAALDPAGLLPPARDYLRYNGSLTTPPCTEGVRWLVMARPMTASPAQIEAIRRALGFANNRPVRPVHARPLLR